MDTSTRGKAVSMPTARAVVWIDHLRARIIRMSGRARHTEEIESELADRRMHRKSGVPGSGRRDADPLMFERIASALGDAHQILIAGPGFAKTELADYLAAKHPALVRRVIAIETVDHPSDPQLVEWAEERFLRATRLGIGD